MAELLTPVKIFCSCSASQNDALLLEQLERHLSPLERQGLISTWSRHLLLAGKVRRVELERQFNAAEIILLLVSSDYLHSDDTYAEMQRALQRQIAQKARVIPILLRECVWQSEPFATLVILPTRSRPIATWRDPDAAWTDVVMGINRVLDELRIPMRNGMDVPEIEQGDQRGSLSGLLMGGDSLRRSDQKRKNMNTDDKSDGVTIHAGDKNTIIGKVTDGGAVHITYKDEPTDGIKSLEKGSKALWNGNYQVARRELRRATEDIDEENQPENAARAYCFLALALLGEELPRDKGISVMEAIENMMMNAMRIAPCTSYYRILASIKEDYLSHNGFQLKLDEVSSLRSKGSALKQQGDDDEPERYFQRCQPRLRV